MTPKILAAVDIAHRESCEAILAEAALLAKCKDAEFHVCYVLPYGFYSYIHPYIPQNVLDDTAQRAKSELGDLATLPAVADLQVKTHLRQGGVYQQLLLVADEISADTIVINAALGDDGSTGHLGPIAAHVGRYAKCKVMILR